LRAHGTSRVSIEALVRSFVRSVDAYRRRRVSFGHAEGAR
jgi:hypothetical protein